MFEKNMKNLDFYDICLDEAAMITFALFVITVWAGAMELVHKIHWGWFLGATIVLIARPCYRFWLKK
jgi:hypothetical protein